MKVVPSVIVKKLFMQGKMVTVNQEVDYDTAEAVSYTHLTASVCKTVICYQTGNDQESRGK